MKSHHALFYTGIAANVGSNFVELSLAIADMWVWPNYVVELHIVFSTFFFISFFDVVLVLSPFTPKWKIVIENYMVFCRCWLLVVNIGTATLTHNWKAVLICMLFFILFYSVFKWKWYVLLTCTFGVAMNEWHSWMNYYAFVISLFPYVFRENCVEHKLLARISTILDIFVECHSHRYLIHYSLWIIVKYFMHFALESSWQTDWSIFHSVLFLYVFCLCAMCVSGRQSDF